jgi:hypothetical protein
MMNPFFVSGRQRIAMAREGVYIDLSGQYKLKQAQAGDRRRSLESYEPKLDRD